MEETAALARALRECPTSDAKDILVELGVLRIVMMGVTRMTTGAGIAGPARTMRMLPLRDDLGATPNGPVNRRMIDDMRAGEVLVIDAMRSVTGGVVGDMMATRLKAAGVEGVVTDGAIRDRAGIDRIGLPVFAAATHPDANRHWSVPWETDTPVQCGGALVLPGDWILADADAAVVVPVKLAAAVAERFAGRKPRDAFSQALLNAGHRLQDAYPLPDSRTKDLDAFLKEGTIPPAAP